MTKTLSQITKKAVEKHEASFKEWVGVNSVADEILFMSEDFLTQAIEGAVREVLESTRVSPVTYNNPKTDDINIGFNQAVHVQEQKIKEFFDGK